MTRGAPHMEYTDAITRGYAEFVDMVRRDGVSEEVLSAAKRAVLDVLACTLAGSAEPAARIALATVQQLGGKPQAGIVGTAERANVAQAALVNGTAAHALDYDDVNYSLTGHPSAPILPAVLALAEHLGSSGREALLAFITGIEVECKLGRSS